MSSPDPAPSMDALDDDDDDYTDFSPNNMMKLTEFEPLSAEEQAELDEILALSA